MGPILKELSSNSYEASEDVFIATLSPNGSLAWAKSVAWGGGVDRGNSLTIDNIGGINLIGFFNDSLFLQNDTLVVAKSTINNFLSTYDNDGNFLNAYPFVQTNKKGRSNSISMAIDGDLLITGFFIDSLFFGNESLKSQGAEDVFILSRLILWV